jgi:hypothetical protein
MTTAKEAQEQNRYEEPRKLRPGARDLHNLFLNQELHDDLETRFGIVGESISFNA